MEAIVFDWDGTLVDTLAALYVPVYLFLALRTAYGGTRWWAARDAVIVTVAYTVALLAATGVVVVWAIFGRGWFRSLGIGF